MDGNNALYIKAIQVFISTFETLPMAICIKGLAGDAEEPGDHDHTADLRSDQSQ
jgi:hypothetical protein